MFPELFCDTNELIRLSCLVPDPISMKLDSHTVTLNSLTNNIVHYLPSLLSAPVSDNVANFALPLISVLGYQGAA